MVQQKMESSSDELSSSSNELSSSSSEYDSSDSEYMEKSLKPQKPVAKTSRRVLTEKKTSINNFKNPRDPLNADVDTSTCMSTKDLTEKIKAEIKKYKIPQAYFAKTLLGKTQGTFSELLKKPKPWEELRWGKAAFVRMYNWWHLSKTEKFKALGLNSDHGGTWKEKKNNKKSEKKAPVTSKPEPQRSDFNLGLTDVQRRVLWGVFEKGTGSYLSESTSASFLKLPIKTVMKFFCQARRQKRIEMYGVDSDEEELDWSSEINPESCSDSEEKAMDTALLVGQAVERKNLPEFTSIMNSKSGSVSDNDEEPMDTTLTVDQAANRESHRENTLSEDSDSESDLNSKSEEVDGSRMEKKSLLNVELENDFPIEEEQKKNDEY